MSKFNLLLVAAAVGVVVVGVFAPAAKADIASQQTEFRTLSDFRSNSNLNVSGQTQVNRNGFTVINRIGPGLNALETDATASQESSSYQGTRNDRTIVQTETLGVGRRDWSPSAVPASNSSAPFGGWGGW